jgi:RNA-directed DNA polymerase
METLQEAYRMAKGNNGAPGIDGVTFEAIEESGVEKFLTQGSGPGCQDHFSLPIS